MAIGIRRIDATTMEAGFRSASLADAAAHIAGMIT
jgi:hypothetical protein